MINVVYAHLSRGMDAKQAEDLDRDLATDPALAARFGERSTGADALMALMGGRPPKPSNGKKA